MCVLKAVLKSDYLPQNIHPSVHMYIISELCILSLAPLLHPMFNWFKTLKWCSTCTHENTHTHTHTQTKHG